MSDNQNSTLTPDAMIAQLRAMRQQIPDYTQLTGHQARALASASRVPAEMVNAAANAIGESPLVQTSIGVTVDQIRQDSADTAVWAALEAELAATHRGVAMANLQRRHRLGTTALTTYALSQVLVRRPEHAALLPHVVEMRRTSRLGRSRKAADPTPASAPQGEVAASTQ